MIEFDFAELNLLNKLLHKIKYSELDLHEINQIANSPITNRIILKVQSEFLPIAEGFPKIKNTNEPKLFFTIENHVGQAITKRLEVMDTSTFQEITRWDNSEIENFAKNILGSIDYEESEFDKLIKFITEKAIEKTSG